MENDKTREKVAEYLKLYRELKAETGDDRSAIVILQEVNKDLRMDQIRSERENGNGNGSDELASVKQLNYLKKLGVKIPANLTKKQASALIDEGLGKESE